MQPIKRGSTFHIRRRVPQRYQGVEPRGTIWLSLHTDSPSVAQRKAPEVWGDMIEAWEAKLAGDTTDAERRFEAARELADKRGYRFLAAERVADLPVEELVERVEAARTPSGKADHREAQGDSTNRS